MKNNIELFLLFRRYNNCVLSLCFLLLCSCEDFVEVDLPKDQITGEAVFEDEKTINASLQNVYAELRENAFTTGNIFGVANLMGHYSDELQLISPNFESILFYEQNNVLPTDELVYGFWSKGYNLIYTVNRIIEGVEKAIGPNEYDKEILLGEAYFLRAFIHFYLVNLFGPVPYIKTTDYISNSRATKEEVQQVYRFIVNDLIVAKNLFPINESAGNRFRPDHWTARAMLARIYLYQEDWALAAKEATALISSGGFELNTNLNLVFEKQNSGTIWQLDSEAEGRNTHEGFIFIANAPPPNFAISQNLLESFEEGDTRLTHWIGSVADGTTEWYFPYKYKQNTSTDTTRECSIMFRIAEQYLIAAEAYLEMGNMEQALDYLNPIRQRAILPVLEPSSIQELKVALIHERRIELFTEMGHRFFDLKRKGLATSILSATKPSWEPTDVILPLPESELTINPNLKPQNVGY